MPVKLALQSIPSQSLTTRLDDNLYNMLIKWANGIMCLDLSRNSVLILSGERIVAGTPFLPYSYQESGNFFIITENGDYPDYTKFGVNQFLTYFSQSEIEAASAGT